jgi:hypothetical protein
MRKKLLCILFLMMVAGTVAAGCGNNPDQEGVHDAGGVLDKKDPGPGPQTGEPSQDVTQISSSGDLVDKTFALTGFDKVEASMFDVDIQQGDSFAVAIRVEKSALEFVTVTVEDSWLKIGLDPSRAYNTADIVLRAQVTMPSLTYIGMSLSSDSTVSGFDSAEDTSIELDLGSSLTGDWTVGDCNISLALGSHLALVGAGRDVTVVAAGSSVVDLAEFQVENATVRAEGNSHVTIRPDGELVQTADSSSTIARD